MPRGRPGYEAEEAAQDKARAREALDRKNELIDLAAILQDPKVRNFLWRVMGKTQMFSETFNGNSNLSAHNQGRRAVGLYLYSEIVEADPNAWLSMQATAYQTQIDALAIASSEEAEAFDLDLL